MNEDLTAFWSRADFEDPAFTGDELRRMSATTRHVLASHSLLRQSENLRVVECDACGEGHVEEVEILMEPAGSKRARISRARTQGEFPSRSRGCNSGPWSWMRFPDPLPKR